MGIERQKKWGRYQEREGKADRCGNVSHRFPIPPKESRKVRGVGAKKGDRKRARASELQRARDRDTEDTFFLG